MMKNIAAFFLSVSMMFAATPEQVERYLLISGSEEQLIQFEQMVDQMSRMFTAKDGIDVPLMQDSQMVPIRFREYLQRNLSDSEMDEVIANYNHDVMRKLVSADVVMDEPETIEAYKAFQTRIKQEPLPANRTERVRSIVKQLYDEKVLKDFYVKMYLPIIKNVMRYEGKPVNKKALDAIMKHFVKQIQENGYQTMLFKTRDFTDEELDELDDLAGSSASSHETRAVFGAIVSSMEEAMDNMGKRMVQMIRNRQHPPVRPKAENNTTKSADKNGTK